MQHMSGDEMADDQGQLRTDEGQLRTDEVQLRTDEGQLRSDESQLRTDESQVRTDDSELRTIFCFGFPLDIQYREIRNLFRFLTGYQHCVLNLKGKVPTAFATFDDNHTANDAIGRLQGIVYDEEHYPHTKIQAAMAKSNIIKPNTTTTRKNSIDHMPKKNGTNIFVSRDPQVRGMFDNRLQIGSLSFQNGRPFSNASTGPFPRIEPPNYRVDGEDRFQSVSSLNRTQLSYPYGNGHPESQYRVMPHKSPSRIELPEKYNRIGSPMHLPERSSSGGTSNVAIRTLFIANLGMEATEMELREVFIHQPGFVRITFTRSNPSKSPVSFVKFISNDTALKSLQAFQGMRLKSSVRYGIKIEFAKKNTGERDDRAETLGIHLDGRDRGDREETISGEIQSALDEL